MKSKEFYVMSIFLDTNSKIRNFSPENKFDPSSRVAANGQRLLPPFYAIPIDLSTALFPTFKFSHKLVFIIDGKSTITVDFNPYVLAIQSRPLFSTKLLNENLYNYNFMAGFIEFAKSKLIDGIEAKTDLAFIAAGSSRFWLAPTTTIETEILIRQHMATLVSVSIDRTIIEARYLLEPIIGDK
jgi:hypothetical protein